MWVIGGDVSWWVVDLSGTTVSRVHLLAFRRKITSFFKNYLWVTISEMFINL